MWEYAHSELIARDYDDYFALNRLFELDEQIVARHFLQEGLIVDLGCGSGRALVPLVRRGFRGLAIDLSEEMLDVVREKAELEDLPIECVRANLVEMDSVADDSVDYAICLFSTLGMIRGRENRQKALGHVRRILKAGGLFVLHVHNYWFNLYDPGGPWWLVKNLWRSVFVRGVETGDKFFFYRGIPNMFLHLFTRRELNRALKKAGFRVREITYLSPTRQRALTWPWLLGNLRANGWIVVCQ